MSRIVTVEYLATKEVYEVPTAAAWSRVAKKLVKRLAPGVIVALSGPLGAGKTTFVQSLAHELGIRRIPASPTFALMRSYTIPKTPSKGSLLLRRLIHVDAYRLEKPSDVLALDLDEELADGQSVLVMEWPEHVQAWMKRQPSVMRVTIRMEQEGKKVNYRTSAA